MKQNAKMATSEDSPAAMKLKKMWLKTPVSEEQAAQAVLDPALAPMTKTGEPSTLMMMISSLYKQQLQHKYQSTNVTTIVIIIIINIIINIMNAQKHDGGGSESFL
uniref:Uncharacterized protein n=1 Tax=Anopheles coluzzii TaxID=1518534 RepID=A0A8W7Q132_ANOCL